MAQLNRIKILAQKDQDKKNPLPLVIDPVVTQVRERQLKEKISPERNQKILALAVNNDV